MVLRWGSRVQTASARSEGVWKGNPNKRRQRLTHFRYRYRHSVSLCRERDWYAGSEILDSLSMSMYKYRAQTLGILVMLVKVPEIRRLTEKSFLMAFWVYFIFLAWDTVSALGQWMILIRPLTVTHFRNVRIGLVRVFRIYFPLHPTQMDKTIESNTNASTGSPSTLVVWNFTTSYLFVSPKLCRKRKKIFDWLLSSSWLQFEEWTKIYGPVFSLKLRLTDIIVIGNSEVCCHSSCILRDSNT